MSHPTKDTPERRQRRERMDKHLEEFRAAARELADAFAEFGKALLAAASRGVKGDR